MASAPIREEVACNMDALTVHLGNLGLRMNVEKCSVTPVQHITFIRLTHSGLSLSQCILVPRKSEDFADKSSSVSQDQIGYLQVMKETEVAWLDGLLFSAHIIGVPF